jgi:prophage regulatory protein
MAKTYPAALKIEKRKQVEARTGLSRSSIYQKVAEGTFPKPIRLSAQSVGWLSHEIDEWIEQRIRASRLVDKEVANDQ